MDIRERQLQAVLRMLRQTESNDSDPQSSVDVAVKYSQKWKLLVFDERCADVIRPLLHVQQLREQGVTLFMPLKSGKSKRDAIPDVPAVYFVHPTAENIALIHKDLANQLYDSIYVNFATPIPRPLLESFANGAVESDSVDTIAKVYDQNLGFVSLASNLVSLGMTDSFVAYNKPTRNVAEQEEVAATMQSIAEGLSSIIATLGVVPIIRSPKGGPAEMVAKLTCKILIEMLNDPSNNVFDGFAHEGGASVILQRPVLLVLDRSIDIATVLRHNTQYQPCIHDFLSVDLNHVTLPPSEPGAKGERCLLDDKQDEFWKTHAGKEVNEVVTACNKLLEEVQAAEDKVRKSTSNGTARTDAGSGVGTIMNTVQSLPALMETKTRLRVHLKILTAIMSSLGERNIKFEMTGAIDKAAVLGYISDGGLQIQDKFRLVAVYFLTVSPSSQDVAEVTAALSSQLDAIPASVAGDETTGSSKSSSDDSEQAKHALAFVRKMLTLSRATSTLATPGAPTSGTGSLWSIADQAQQALDRAKRQVQGIVSGKSMCTASRMMDAVCKETTATRVAEVDAEYLYLDPKVQESEVPVHARMRSAFNQGILFTVGGGTYTEYHNLNALGEKSNKQFLYACTEIVNASNLTKQLAACAQGV